MLRCSFYNRDRRDIIAISGGDLVGVGTAVAGLADEASEVMNEFDRPNYRRVEITKTKKVTIQEEFAFSKFDVMFYSMFAGAVIKGISEQLEGRSFYEYIKNEVKSIMDYMNTEIQKLSESAGGAVSQVLESFGEGIGKGVKGVVEGLTEAATTVVDKIGSIVKDILSSFSADLSYLINLPSTMFMALSNKLLENFNLKGMSNLPAVRKSLTNLIGSITTAAKYNEEEKATLTSMINTYIEACNYFIRKESR